MRDKQFLFIAIEGIDGVGKTNCSKLLADKIGGQYYKTPPVLFENIKREIDAKGNNQARFAFYLSSVFYASEEIRSSLSCNPVVCDRYIFSTIAYHNALGVDLSYVCLNKIPILFPDHCFYLYADEQVRRQRIDERKVYSPSDEALEKNIYLQRKVHEEFLKLPAGRIDTSRLKLEEVCEQILHQI